MLSKLWTIDWNDLFNGLVTAIYGAVLTYLTGIFASLYQLVINNQPFEIFIDWKVALVIGVYAGLTYLSKRFTSGKTGTVFAK